MIEQEPNEQPVHEKRIVKQSGRCTRCHKALKRTFMVDGAAYGPVCVRKLFGNLSAATEAKPRTVRTPRPIKPSPQLQFFEPIHADLTTYHGTIVGNDEDRPVEVTRPTHMIHDEYHLEVHDLPLMLEHVNHSPTGFCWGYGGSGPAQLAFAILADYLGDVVRARSLYQEFKSRVIAALPMDEPFIITGRQIEDFITNASIRQVQAL